MKTKPFLVVLLLLVLALGVSAQNFTQKVTAFVQPIIQVVWPDQELDFGNLSMGVNETTTMQIKVYSNIAYSIVLETEAPHLTEYVVQSSMYGKKKLKEPIKVSINNGVDWKNVTNSLVLVSNAPPSVTEDIYDLKYQQILTFPDDQVLTEGLIYKTDIVLFVTPAI